MKLVSSNFCFYGKTSSPTQLYRLTDNEWFDEIAKDLNNLTELDIRIESVTCDGASSIIKAVRRCVSDAIIQRCTVHIQREVLLWLTKHPKSNAGRELRSIVGRLNPTISDREQWGYWVVDLIRWSRNTESISIRKPFQTKTRKERGLLTKWCEKGV